MSLAREVISLIIEGVRGALRSAGRGEPRREAPPKPAPTLPAEALGHILRHTDLTRRGEALRHCERCDKLNTRAEFSTFRCEPPTG